MNVNNDDVIVLSDDAVDDEEDRKQEQQKLVKHNAFSALMSIRTFLKSGERSAMPYLLNISSEFIGLVVNYTLQFHVDRVILECPNEWHATAHSKRSLFDAVAGAMGRSQSAPDIRYLILRYLSLHAQHVLSTIRADCALLRDVIQSILDDQVCTVDVCRVVFLLIASVLQRDVLCARRINRAEIALRFCCGNKGVVDNRPLLLVGDYSNGWRVIVPTMPMMDEAHVSLASDSSKNDVCMLFCKTLRFGFRATLTLSNDIDIHSLCRIVRPREWLNDIGVSQLCALYGTTEASIVTQSHWEGIAQKCRAEWRSKLRRHNTSTNVRLHNAIHEHRFTVFVPFHIDNDHWILVVIDPVNAQITIYDSIIASRAFDPLHNLIDALDIGDYECANADDCPQQNDRFNCGVFVVLFVYYLARSRAVPRKITVNHDIRLKLCRALVQNEQVPLT